MQYREFRPGDAARPFIDCYWTLESEGGSAVQRVVPDGRSELILNLAQPFEALSNGEWCGQPKAFLAGQITGPLMLRPGGPVRILGIRFHPQGAAQLFRMPMDELTGQFTRLADLSSALFRELERGAADLAELEQSLLRCAGDPDLLVTESVGLIVKTRGDCDIAQVARHLGISTRQLERRFKSAVGLPPKLFCRIQRFQHVFQVLEGGRSDWVSAALECGYHDQSHLIRDFREFAGEAPAALLNGDDLARHFLRKSRMSDFSKTGTSGSL